MKKKIEIVASEESCSNLSPFASVEDMNRTVRIYREKIAADVKRADVRERLLKLLEMLKRYSCKFKGVSFLCKRSIAAAMGVSYKTIQRLMAKLAELGMIRELPRKRQKDMLQTSNAVLILPAEEEVSNKQPAEVTEKCPTIKTTTNSLKQENKNINNNTNVMAAPSTMVVDDSVQTIQESDFVAHWVPKQFTNLAARLNQGAKAVQELWKVVRQCNHNGLFPADQQLRIGRLAAKELIMKMKDGVSMKKGIFAYFHGIVSNLMDIETEKQADTLLEQVKQPYHADRLTQFAAVLGA
ncbi:helix-turn-helix domain-containing protein [Ectobacillus ponti]|uniref:Helix-turn-helix domain-containing protein n=1 Tax=Ectobacillus ponti TaxID=2961894 RepID=A0AA42BPZ5_9BACI|nr:helix-turn-helix domain-containing protein [Ectobacillus ponti]MCP8969745.1 helix-turn-helix domain-containing protein [Ectobacillus ponti]